jgi:hypothetical protein
VVLIRWSVRHRGRALVDEQLSGPDGEERTARPLGGRTRSQELTIEGRGARDVVGEERDLADAAHVAISNSRRTSFSDVLRSVDGLRSPTMSAHGTSNVPAGYSFGREPGSTTERGGT